MGYGPNIITDPIDRLETSIGNWTEDNVQGVGSFSWVGSARIQQESAPVLEFYALLEKDFFLPIVVANVYTVTLDVLWPSDSSGLIGLTFGVNGGTPFVPSFDIAETPYDVWRETVANLSFEPTFDNNLRQLYFRLTSQEVIAHVYIKNLSIREYVPSKIQYLPFVGIG